MLYVSRATLSRSIHNYATHVQSQRTNDSTGIAGLLTGMYDLIGSEEADQQLICRQPAIPACPTASRTQPEP